MLNVCDAPRGWQQRGKKIRELRGSLPGALIRLLSCHNKVHLTEDDEFSTDPKVGVAIGGDSSLRSSSRSNFVKSVRFFLRQWQYSPA